ncbi:hypothetical protein TIFTF001_025199 [Ficus carica]|uniref:Uncharacterized protein n=1 Tax=Ficus carica TaxID=3494 RepID=A0AA88ANT3_FICCA|nr:hypothetical protein TIFTF001_025199 [Ficus carica]
MKEEWVLGSGRGRSAFRIGEGSGILCRRLLVSRETEAFLKRSKLTSEGKLRSEKNPFLSSIRSGRATWGLGQAIRRHENKLHRYKKRMARMRGMKRKAEVTGLTNEEHDENPNVNRYSTEREEAIQLKIL